jgi:ankyrin repeat protein
MPLFQVCGIFLFSIFAWAAVLPATAGAAPTEKDENRALWAAIRDGDSATAKALLEGGADANARDESGSTALMHAVVNADIGMVRLLLDKGADVNAQNKSGATALLWGLHDPDKVKLLLDTGAKVPEAALFVAVTIPGASRTVKSLADKGANLNAANAGYTPLMAATRGGDLDTIRFLIDQGADVRAKTKSGYTALYGATSWPGNAAVVRLLLEKGADPKVSVEIPAPAEEAFSPLMAAAVRGDPETVKRLLDASADANVQGGRFARTALLMAATTGREEVVKDLLDKGADVNAKDHLGNTPLQWAKRRGATDIVKLLEKAGGKDSQPADAGEELPRLHKELDADSVKRAVAKSLPLLQQSGETFTSRKGCISCHHQSLVAMTVGLARRHGFEVDEKAATRERANVLSNLDRDREKILLGTGVSDELLPAYTLAGLAAEDQKPNPTTGALVHFLVLRQRPDGSWRTPAYRPPQDESDITFTALAARGLSQFAPKGRRKEIEGSIARAREWLIQAKAQETEDNAFRLLGLRWTNAEPRHIEQAAAALLREQRADGGWSQLPTLDSDAYATGQVLCALHEGGGLAVSHEAYRRGVDFLLKEQLADGSWLVRTRSFPLQSFVGTRFPHGRSQFISISATSWATMALARTSQPRDPKDREPNR